MCDHCHHYPSACPCTVIDSIPVEDDELAVIAALVEKLATNQTEH